MLGEKEKKKLEESCKKKLTGAYRGRKPWKKRREDLAK